MIFCITDYDHPENALRQDAAWSRSYEYGPNGWNKMILLGQLGLLDQRKNNRLCTCKAPIRKWCWKWNNILHVLSLRVDNTGCFGYVLCVCWWRVSWDNCFWCWPGEISISLTSNIHAFTDRPWRTQQLINHRSQIENSWSACVLLSWSTLFTPSSRYCQ